MSLRVEIAIHVMEAEDIPAVIDSLYRQVAALEDSGGALWPGLHFIPNKWTTPVMVTVVEGCDYVEA